MTALVFSPSLFGFKRQTYRLIPRMLETFGASGIPIPKEMNGGPMWRFEFADAPLWDAEKLQAFRAFIALADGGVTEFEVEMCDLRQAPVPLVGGAPYYGVSGVTHSDATLFGDHAGYSQPALINATNVGAWALRATSGRITTDGGVIKGGEHFAIEHDTWSHRTYRIGTSVAVDASTYDVTFRPPLREAIATATDLDFVSPSVMMQMVDPAGAEPEVELHQWATAKVAFREAF